jgi:hypothetical protein
MTMFCYRLVRECAPGVVEFLIYIGPFDRTPPGWIVVTRKLILKRITK